MNTTTSASMLLLTTDDLNECGQALGHLLASSMPPDTLIRVVSYGAEAETISASILATASQQGISLESASMPGATRDAAINAAIQEIPPSVDTVAIVGDRVRVATGWLQELTACLKPKAHGLNGREIDDVGEVGLVCACTDQTSSESQRIDLAAEEIRMGLDGYARARMEAFAGGASVADVLDGFCALVTTKTIARLGEFLDTSCGEWAWADLCLRIGRTGAKCMVSEAVYVGRSKSVPLGAQVPGSAEDRLAFYEKHPIEGEQNLVAVLAGSVGTWQNMQMLRAVVSRIVQTCDGFIFISINNPLDMRGTPEFENAFEKKAIDKTTMKLLKACDGAGAETVSAALQQWLKTVIDEVPGGTRGLPCRAQVHLGSNGGVSARNQGMKLAADMGATAVLVLTQGELIEPAVNRDTFKRLLLHPNPLVRAFDVGTVFHWDSPMLVRDDAPWGHGGGYRGGKHAPRLYRIRDGVVPQIAAGKGPTMLPDHGVSAYRVSGIRLRALNFMRANDRRDQGIAGHGEGMRVSAYNPDNRLGLHVLIWEKENPEDIARWMDQAHALADAAVLVWTDEWSEKDKLWTLPGEAFPEEWPETGPGRVMAQVAKAHGCQWVHQPLDDNFSQARNAGLDALQEVGGINRAWFVDPDEWLSDPNADLLSIRNMVCSNRAGWIFQTANYRKDQGTPTLSDSMRISTLDPAGKMRMTGRVHESFSKAVNSMPDSRATYAPFVVQHRGMSYGPEEMAVKLDKYERLLRIQLEDEPHDPGAWVSLGWNYFNDGHESEGVECYQRALSCAGGSYLPYKEMAYHKLREARSLLEKCEERLNPGHAFFDLCSQMNKWLGTYAGPHPIIERVGDRGVEPLPRWRPPAAAE